MVDEIKLDNFFQACNLPMAICSLDLIIIDLNAEAERVLLYKKKEIVGKTLADITPVGDLSFDFTKLNALLKGELNSYTIKRAYRNKKGEKVSGAVTISSFLIGDVKYLLGVFHENLAELDPSQITSDEASTINRILSLNPDIHYIMDIGLKNYIYQNVDILSYFGYTKADINGSNEIEFLISKIDNSSIKEVAQANQVFKTSKGVGEFVEVEYRFLSKNEGWKWLRARSTPLILESKAKIRLSYGIIQDITDRKEAESKLRTQEAFIQQVANIVPDALYVFDLNTFKNVYSNFSARTFLGYTEEEWGTPGVIRIREDFQAHVDSQISRLSKLRDDEVLSDEVVLFSKNDKETWVLFKSKVFDRDDQGNPTQILSVVVDIDNYKQTLNELANSRRTKSAILGAIPDLLLVVTKEGYYSRVYSGVDMKVDNSNDLLGKHISEILEKDTSDAIMLLIQSCLKTGETKFLDFQHKSRNEVEAKYFSNYISKINDDEVIILVRDETQKKLAEFSLAEKLELLSHQNEQLEQFIVKNTELERFAYILSHDLKEPLRSIHSVTELISIELEQTQNPKLQNLLLHLTESTERMNSLIDGVLQYSKVDNTKKQMANIPLNAILQMVVKDLERKLTERNVRLEIQDFGKLMGEQTQLRQLFQNLINNAIKFNHQAQPLVEIGIHNGVYFVKDNGIGIRKEFRKSIFQMFSKVHPSKKFDGQGLGLSICKKIVERHHGKIWIEDNPTGGTIFYFTLLEM